MVFHYILLVEAAQPTQIEEEGIDRPPMGGSHCHIVEDHMDGRYWTTIFEKSSPSTEATPHQNISHSGWCKG